MLIGVAACSFGSTPVGQGASNSSASKRRDAGSDADAAATTTTKRRVSTRKTDARVADSADEELDAGDDETATEPEVATDAGRIVRTPAAGSSGTGTKPADADAGKKPTEQPQRMDAGTVRMPTTPPAADAGPRIGDASAGDAGDAGDPIGNLEDLAKMSPSERTTATINKFLMTLSEGDAPASSIKEFLNAINDEVDCKMNPLTYECLTACQAVGTTCALCILEEECRQTMLDICGVTALGGCIPRR